MVFVFGIDEDAVLFQQPFHDMIVVVGGGPMQRRVSSVVYHVDVVLVVLDYFFAQF